MIRALPNSVLSFIMPDTLIRLWRGELPLAHAFWEYAVLYGTLANLMTTGLAFAVIAAGLPAILAIAIFFSPLPYNVTAVVGVWRSADRYQGRAEWRTLARVAIVIWVLVMTIV